MSDTKTVFGRIAKDIRSYGGFAAVFLLYSAATHFTFGVFCPTRIVTGLPCPGCGMTRAVFCFATGQFAKGWAYHPLGICWLLWAVAFFAFRYLLGKEPRWMGKAVGILLGLTVVFYLFRMHAVFPGPEPMRYTDGNLAERIFPGYRELIFRLFG